MSPHRRPLGTREVVIVSVAFVVAARTLGGDVTGYLALGGAFAVALVAGFGINLLLGLSAADLAATHPGAGFLYDPARRVVGGRGGRTAGTFLGLAFYGMFALVASGETAAGAADLKALLGSTLPLEAFVVGISVAAVIPNVLGIRATVRVSAVLVLVMIGIRWGFGIAGFLGLGATGEWSAAHLDAGAGPIDLFGDGGVLTAGLMLAVWSFVGIEFACSLADEVRAPRRTLPRSIVLGLLAALATSLVMGLGVLGTAPVAAWRAAAEGAAGCDGACPHLAAAGLFLGETGRGLMALASAAAALSTMTIAYAAMPRLVYGLARDGNFFGPLSKPFGRLHGRSGTPVPAVLLTAALYLVPALSGEAVAEWLSPAAYVWMLLYVAVHVLAWLDGHRRAALGGAGRRGAAVALLGLVVTLGGLSVAFAGAHRAAGGRAFFVLAIALAAALLAVEETPTPAAAP